MTVLDKDNPQFTIAIRGYDRYQVDEYLLRMQQLLGEAEERTRAAESHQDRTHDDVGPRVAKIFELAAEEADDMRDEADHEARETTAKARMRAEKIVRSAREAAESITQRSRAEHSELLADLSDERDQIRAEVELLERQRTELASHLRRLHDAIGRLGVVAEEAAPRPDENARTRPLKAVAAS
jgi:cell division septum initiation protein DivIVA